MVRHMAVGSGPLGRTPIAPAERRARRWRLLVIVLVAIALVGGILYLSQRKKADEAAADAAAATLASELEPQLGSVNLSEAFTAYADWTFNRTTPEAFPTSPEVAGALLDFSATPNSVTLTYQVTTNGIDRCVTGVYSFDSGTSTSVNDCIHR